MNQPTYSDGTPRHVGISEDDIDAMAREALSKLGEVRAMRNKFVAWIAPVRKEGSIEIPWDFAGNSCEAVMVDDGTGAQIPAGTRIMVHPNEGYLHKVNGVELCFLPKSALMLLQTA
jgi:hypothetical protein